MKLSFKTREMARKFCSDGKAKGFARKLIDNGKDAVQNGKSVSRYAVALR